MQTHNFFCFGRALCECTLDQSADEETLIETFTTPSSCTGGSSGNNKQNKKNFNLTSITGKRKRRDMKKPEKPLSTYNYFFKAERARILESGEENDGGLEKLCKKIYQRYAALEKDELAHYKKLAVDDLKRYKQEMEVYLGLQEVKVWDREEIQ